GAGRGATGGGAGRRRAWGDHPTFRVRGKNFVFADHEAKHLTVKLILAEAAAVTASDPRASPAVTVSGAMVGCPST
nr:hypothetical protein [Micromonospora sp. DSM 115978]